MGLKEIEETERESEKDVIIFASNFQCTIIHATRVVWKQNLHSETLERFVKQKMKNNGNKVSTKSVGLQHFNSNALSRSPLAAETSIFMRDLFSSSYRCYPSSFAAFVVKWFGINPSDARMQRILNFQDHMRVNDSGKQKHRQRRKYRKRVDHFVLQRWVI